MELDSISSSKNPATSKVYSSGSGASATTAESIAKTKSDFLNLLTTQLKNQDPTKPTDNAAFTQQITAINALEQQLDTNTKLGQLVTSQNNAALTTQLASSVNYIGKSVQIENNLFKLNQTGTPKLSYDVPKGTTNSIITISDSKGQVVGTYKGQSTEGIQNLSWDGKDADGKRLPAGDYKITVSLTDTNSKATAATTYVFGNVTSVETQNSKSSVVVDDSYVVPIEKVRSIEQQVALKSA